METRTIQEGLKARGYIANDLTARVLAYTRVLSKPLLIEGPAGAGKTELAKAWSRHLDRELIRLQCYEGINENQALYEWNYQKQLLYIQARGEKAFDGSLIYSDEFLLKRPLLAAIASDSPKVLLIDEIDKSDEAFESYLLEILSDWQVTIAEIGTIRAKSIPAVILTSNGHRNLSEALRRRCLYLHLDYPDEARELAILRCHYPDLSETLGRQAVALVRKLRRSHLKKHPSISEVIDWIRVLEEAGVTSLTDQAMKSTLCILLKHREDYDIALSIIAREESVDLSHP